jgi:hypothetical protein
MKGWTITSYPPFESAQHGQFECAHALDADCSDISCQTRNRLPRDKEQSRRGTGAFIREIVELVEKVI